MNILINTSNLRTGGGLQVAESICSLLPKYTDHHYVIALTDKLQHLNRVLSKYPNIKVLQYSQPLTIGRVLTGRDTYLDEIVSSMKINAVLTIFGPSRWRPKCFHLCGFAMPHIVFPESPYWKLLSLSSRLKSKIRIHLMKRDFRVNNDVLWCENESISYRLRIMFKDKEVYTITNNYHQIFDHSESCDKSIKLPTFNGLTLLTIRANYPHKNLPIALAALYKLRKLAPDVHVRFVFTIKENQFPNIPLEFKGNFIFLGPISISQCPPLYKQSDVMFQPSLLECFSATYAEAMRMKIPILTTDLDFAHSLCGDSAIYYKATDPEDLAKCIIELFYDKNRVDELIANGVSRLEQFDKVENRIEKLINIIEHKVSNNVNIQR